MEVSMRCYQWIEEGNWGRLPGGVIPELSPRGWIRNCHMERGVDGGAGRRQNFRQEEQYLQTQRHDNQEQQVDLKHRVWVRGCYGWVPGKPGLWGGLTQLFRAVCILGIRKEGRKTGGKEQRKDQCHMSLQGEREGGSRKPLSEHCLQHQR